MRCFHPIKAHQPVKGERLIFNAPSGTDGELEIPCGQCIGCRLKRAEAWAVRCVYESRMHRENCFITLTYDDDYLPPHGNLQYSDFQKFCKRLRKSKGSFRFFMAGEYGEQEFRPHYHACLFGMCFDDRKLFKRSDSGCDVYTSENLSKLWPFGHASVGNLTYESAAYVARYVVKKVTGADAVEHYLRSDEYGEVVHLTPEFTHMSLKPGIGSSFYDKYGSEIRVRDACIVQGRERQVPRYFDKRLEVLDIDAAEAVAFDRYLARLNSKEVLTEDRLRTEEIVAKARLSFKKRFL